MTQNYYVKNAARDVSGAVKAKNNQSYLPWAAAWQYLLEADPQCDYTISLTEIMENDVVVDVSSTLECPNKGHFVEVNVKSNGVVHSMLYPVLNGSNKPIMAPNVSEINKSIHRALAKAIAYHGIGIGVFTKDNQAIPEDFIDYNTKREKVNGNEYLSWAWAWDAIKRRDPNANFTIERFGMSKMPFFEGAGGTMVKVGVTFNGIYRSEILPVLDMRKQPKLKDVTVSDINNAIQRAMTKAIALHGIGLELYSGEDLPGDEAEDSTDSASTSSAAASSSKSTSTGAKATGTSASSSKTVAKPKAGASLDEKQAALPEEAKPEESKSAAEESTKAEDAAEQSTAGEVADAAVDSDANAPTGGVSAEEQEMYDRLWARFKKNPATSETLIRVAETQKMLSPAAMEMFKQNMAAELAA